MRAAVGAMARRLAAGLIASLLVTGLAACGNRPAQGPPPNPPLYEIAASDGTVEGWLLGTIHALPDTAEWRTPAIGQVIDRADLLVVEVGEAKGRDAGPSLYNSLAKSPGLPPLADRLPADLRPRLAALMDQGGLDDNAFAAEESWAAAIGLARIGAVGDPANGVDRALIAAFADRPVRELEGLRGQLSLFDRLPESAQRTMLEAVVREGTSAGRDPERLTRAWLTGDAATIEQATREGFLADPTLREALLTGRNRRWAAVLAPLLAETPRPLIAVGAAHLLGPDGLAALLEAQGYRLRRIP